MLTNEQLEAEVKPFIKEGFIPINAENTTKMAQIIRQLWEERKGLYGTIASQKQTHDALIKKLKEK